MDNNLFSVLREGVLIKNIEEEKLLKTFELLKNQFWNRVLNAKK